MASSSSLCEHILVTAPTLAAPRLSQQVHKEECTLCFDDQDGEQGIDVCLTCFNGGCSGNDRNHSALHFKKTGHAIALNVRRTRKPEDPNKKKEQEDAPAKLQILAETEADKYDFSYRIKCLACDSIREEVPMALEAAVAGVISAMSSAKQSEVQSWEEEIVSCTHTEQLVQEPPARKIVGGETCGQCEMDSNLWLCLTCGNLGCGRAQFGGVGGHGHGLAHFEQSGHPCSVKQGTITAEGSADVYCYVCNDARLDKKLAQHLSHLGIQVASLSKTEKSMTELQVEQNLRFDFSMTGEDGQQLEPVEGPGLTGIRNLGNSCYLASTLQSLFSTPAFAKRYGEAYHPHTLACERSLPADCLECQMGKIADGLLSGRYAVPNREGGIFQAGIKPSMLKALVGKGHAEFSTMKQQDADEFLQHLVSKLQEDNKRVQAERDATLDLACSLETRLQCTECKKVRYTVDRQDAGISLPVPLRSAGEGAFEPVSLVECLEGFTSEETIADYACASCKHATTAVRQVRFKTLPEVLAIAVRRFQLIGWVPQKVNVQISVPVDEPLQMDKYLAPERPQGEEEMPEGGAEEPQIDAAAIGQLQEMGFSELRAKKALLAVGGNNAEEAMNWLFAHMEDPDIDAPILSGAATSTGPDTSMLEDMGFSKAQATKALRLNHGNPEIAVAWLFENSDDPGDDLNAAPPSSASADTPAVGRADLPASYTLQSFISHKGPSVHSGHYVSHVHKPKETGWVLFNDEKVVRAPVSSGASEVGVEGLSKL